LSDAIQSLGQIHIPSHKKGRKLATITRKSWLPWLSHNDHISDSPPLQTWLHGPWHKAVEMGTAHSWHPKGY